MCNKYPLYSIELEKVILGLINIKNSLIEEAALILEKDDFYRTSSQMIFAAACFIKDRGERVDLVMLHNYFELNGGVEKIGGATNLSSLMDGVPHSYIRNFGIYCIKLKQLSILREIQNICSKVMNIGRNKFEEPTVVLQKLKKEIDAYLRYDKGNKRVSKEGQNERQTFNTRRSVRHTENKHVYTLQDGSKKENTL